MAGYVAVPTKLRRFRAINKLNQLAEKNSVSAHVANTINDLYELSQDGQMPANLHFALRYVPGSRIPKEIKESFESFVQAILKLLSDLFCTLGRCFANSILVDPIRRIESCILCFEPYSSSPN